MNQVVATCNLLLFLLFQNLEKIAHGRKKIDKRTELKICCACEIMDPWTPSKRDAFVQSAVDSKEMKGREGPYFFNVLPKVDTATTDEDPRRSLLTDALAHVIYGRDAYRGVSLCFYDLLLKKMMAHPLLSMHMFHNIVVLIKGSNAHAYFVPNSDLFRHSDMDLSVCINPNLQQKMFDEIMVQVEIVVRQAISQYKRTLDHMLFLNKPIDGTFMSPEDIAEFKKEVCMALAQLESPPPADTHRVEFVSPFEDDAFRNACSRNSFLLTNSKGHEHSVVRVEVPHFSKCERIPLRKTPLFCSFNETIDFVRDGVERKGRFNLYRLRMNHLCVHYNAEGKVIKEEKVAADFIDVSVPDKEDAELVYFWKHGRSMNLYEPALGFWVEVPDLQTCISELERILTQYESVPSKKEKREKKLEALKKVTGF